MTLFGGGVGSRSIFRLFGCFFHDRVDKGSDTCWGSDLIGQGRSSERLLSGQFPGGHAEEYGRIFSDVCCTLQEEKFVHFSIFIYLTNSSFFFGVNLVWNFAFGQLDLPFYADVFRVEVDHSWFPVNLSIVILVGAYQVFVLMVVLNDFLFLCIS